VEAKASTRDGRTDVATGAVPTHTVVREVRDNQMTTTYRPLSPAERAIAVMTAETKAKRRVTLSICGLGILDESELDLVK
jgi:hypothetical protein